MGNNKDDRVEKYISEELNSGSGFWVKTKKLIAKRKSKYQKIELIDTESYGLALRIDDYWMTSEKDEFYYHENMVHPAAISHGRPKSALIIGGGDGGALKEYLRYNCIQKVVLAEIDEDVVDFCKEHLKSVHKGAFQDPRLQLKIVDGMKFVRDSSEKYDLMMLDLTDPFGPAEALYTSEFLADCQNILSQNGLLSIHLGSPVMKPQVFGRLVATLKSVFKIVRPFMVYVPLYGTWWGMATASQNIDPMEINQNEVEGRIREYFLQDLKYYNSSIHSGMFSLPNFVQKLCCDQFVPISLQFPLQETGLNPKEHRKIKVRESHFDKF